MVAFWRGCCGIFDLLLGRRPCVRTSNEGTGIDVLDQIWIKYVWNGVLEGNMKAG